ncbi:flagellar basal body protein FliL [Nibricoccus aquaticus]|uniref:Flagellar protein FliL n=1 Tax=Nibricoccus aquaticus TaxID=2576891 RepID=A0A290QBR1_9BACT|nr:flagellar basal body-associated FliL family protein [Nibricoccus aquaticus]ATC63666.1 flagellar basal body protein FliL [Nibricoccus aquaticus]
MAAKPEAAPAKEAAKEAAPGPDAAAAKPAAKPMAALLPVIAVIVLAPVLSFAIGQFVLIPQLKKQIATMPATAEGDHAAEAEAHAEPAKESGGHGKKGEAAPSGPGNEYLMENIVVNLAGTMGTRYLKTSFLIKGTDKNLRATFEAKKPEIVDISLNVLSSLSLADLEEAGAKNIIREKLILAYNQAIGRRVAEQIYFADFVVQ